ncbi:1,6-anhydro-N-acetylmuramyl-L-alanine amidase AmpD [Enterovibrio coralii]|uniref:1,6-anhydro-N-acetylmuramyl-L-alanine amidase AmpD n=1 Tax=Enterovibrio coralii TaxID=294935 RepID=A0A135I3R3_9GAMM|nr:1,6-anhydro-N-acetylmuramyl-L-alanine amidase AmpD [Enterovibrio coralii]KXF80090.1 N-acetyl-anhydromuranmyl-L-alanine amidase [Enterovibrio coralii]
MLTISDHILESAVYLPSPHFNERPDPSDVSLLVVHNISLPPSEFGGPYIEQFFQGKLTSKDHPYFDEIRHLDVSAHCLIKRDGSVVQFVPFDKRAWHAGVSCFEGREQCNDFSIGIELEGTDDLPYTDEQYHVLTLVTQSLLHYYPKMAASRITGHEHIASGRKTDPGLSFNWQRYQQALGAEES